MCEIQHLMYTSGENRTMDNILRIHNQTFLHMLFLKKIIKSNPLSPKLSAKKKGKYLHTLLTHGPQMFRIISSSLKTITSLTSNFHPDHVLLNCLIRLQVKADFNSGYHHDNESIVTKLSKGLPKKVRSTIHWIIDEYPKEWKTHLANISDFLLEKDVWWEEYLFGFVLNDMKENQSTNIAPHHFRSWNILTERNYLQNCCKLCLEDKNLIPAVNIFVEDENENMKVCNVDNLKYASLDNTSSVLPFNEKYSTIPTTIKEISTKTYENHGLSASAEIKEISIETEIDLSINGADKIDREVPTENIVSIKSFIAASIESNFFTRTATILYDILPEEIQHIRKI